MKTPKNPFSGQLPIDRAAIQMRRKLDKIWESVKELRASQIALLSTLKETPAGDEAAVLSGGRWAFYQERLEAALQELSDE